jgi:hypothetical protein
MSMPSLVRRKHGEGHTYELDGRWAPGVTTLIGKGFPRPGLLNWVKKASANEIVDRWEEILQLAPSDRRELIYTASDRDRDAAARRGTEVHKIARKLLAGQTVDVPEELDDHVKSYLRFLDDWQVRELLVETSIAKRRPRYCGTFDMVADLADGRRWLVDLKTTRSGVYPENALQLAGYRFADFYLDADFTEQPMPAIDQCGVVWIRADGYDLYPLRVGELEFELFQYVARIARFADRDLANRFGSVDDVIGAPLLPAEVIAS